MKSTAHRPAVQGSHRVEGKKGAGRKMVPHRVTLEKGENGGYSADVHNKYADGKGSGMGEWPDSTHHAFSSFQEAHDALPEMFDEAHPSTKPAKAQEGSEELPE